ncbi:Lipoxygenase 6, chloroplastic [Ancistrocladus abbreviatus]
MLTGRPSPSIGLNLTDPPHRRLTRATVSGATKVVRTRKTTTTTTHFSRVGVRAAISSGDRTVENPVPAPAPVSTEFKDRNGFLSASSSSGTQVKAVVRIRRKLREKLVDKIEGQWHSFINSIGQGILIQLISEQIDPVTKSGKSVESYVRGRLSESLEHVHTVEYEANFTVPLDFGNPGAVLITNFHNKEFYLVEIVLHWFGGGPIYFTANSWIHSRNDNPESRIIFKNQAYLPSQTPPGIKDLRREDLLSIRGNGKGERKLHERVYDYAPYNDLGNPDKDDLARPVLAGEERPYPRRCRTGRPGMKSDQECESRVEKPHPVYVPRDEAFEEIKQETFSAGRLKAVLHNLIPQIAATLSSSDIPFNCFSDIDKLYNDGFMLKEEDQLEKAKKLFVDAFTKQVLSIGDRLFKYEIPDVIKRDRFAWLRDNEFARQALAGVNPVNIELLKEFPIFSKLDPTIYGPPESAITKEVLEEELHGRMSIEEAIQSKRLFIIDYHDLILPFIDKINSLPGRKAYASRTIFFYTNTGVLRPIAIELSLPPTSSSPGFKRVYTQGHDSTTHWLWKQAKAHVCAIDAGVHQLVNHWLRTHASMEPYIIATHRQLSSMHPVYKLLHPHMRYTFEINALARQSLINGGGVIEACFTPGKYSMEISSAAYKSMWRFDKEGLPADLIRRGMAVEDPSAPHGIKLVIEDYPYAADGLLIWSAIKEWVEPYVGHFYYEPNAIKSDVELQEWWKEIKNTGHTDKKNEPWWPELNTKEDLTSILTTMIWVASGQHAAVNFGQYPFGGYVPNRPTLMRKLIPQENEPEYEKFLMNPQRSFLSALPTQLQATKVMAVQDTLSTHSADEEYLGQLHHLHGHWINDPEVEEMFKRFSDRLKEIEEIIHQRNKDRTLTNRCSAGIPPYELLLPTSGPGVTGRGIPNSISI